MNVLVAYDVATSTPEGERRLRHIAKICEDFGQRVQYSVFECVLGETQWVTFRHRLLSEMKADEDSLRFYMIPGRFADSTETHGRDRRIDFEGPLIV
ncbi:CRISPR-associated endoribonuclease Cas2 [Planctomycetes bacterium Pan216]|uniref:CRISPR-associated endoribonuclease Cas2 n=1 Tax=Kolteria novifilia TaxID=2527975 RepID=A0A518B606_9BACT|nr:CRISPR-associated endoribonuclease Cas2 [Planctomycetes bacterium Pan216]